MLEQLAVLNKERAQEALASNQKFIPIKIGVGLNTGRCVVGNMGSDMRFQYTVLAILVNLASRLEGQTKSYGVRFLSDRAPRRPWPTSSQCLNSIVSR